MLEKEEIRKKKFLNSVYMNVGHRSLGICSHAFCRVFACAVIHTAKCRICLVLKSVAIHSVLDYLAPAMLSNKIALLGSSAVVKRVLILIC